MSKKENSMFVNKKHRTVLLFAILNSVMWSELVFINYKYDWYSGWSYPRCLINTYLLTSMWTWVNQFHLESSSFACSQSRTSQFLRISRTRFLQVECPSTNHQKHWREHKALMQLFAKPCVAWLLSDRVLDLRLTSRGSIPCLSAFT